MSLRIVRRPASSGLLYGAEVRADGNFHRVNEPKGLERRSQLPRRQGRAELPSHRRRDGCVDGDIAAYRLYRLESCIPAIPH